MTQSQLVLSARRKGADVRVDVGVPMNDGFCAKKLVEDFAVLVEAAGGVQRLRGFVLDLAARGRLVPQVSGDGTGVQLLAHIADGEANAGTPDPFAVPDSWAWATVGRVCAYVQRGKSPKYVDASSVPVVSQKCVQWEGFMMDRVRFLDARSLDSYGVERFLREGDLLWNSTGHGTVGRVAVFRADQRYPKVVADSHVTVLRPRIDSRFLWCWLASPTVQRTIDDLVTGSTKQTELSTSTVIAHPVPVPPLAEQKRIVAKVDQLMGLIDELEAKQMKKREVQTRFRASALDALTTAEGPEELASAWKRAYGSFEVLFERRDSVGELRRAIFSFACRGALTARTSGSGLDVLRGIAEARGRSARERTASEEREGERHIAKVATQDALPPAVRLPENWIWGTLLAACERLVDCHNKTAPYTSNGVMLVRTSNIRDGKITLDGVRYVTEGTYAHWSRRCPPEPGDVLLTREAPMGEVGMIEPGTRLCMGQRMMLLRTVPGLLDPRYLVLAIRDPAFQKRMVAAAVGSTVKHLRVGDVESLYVPIPPPEEQQRVVAKVEALMNLCDDLETRLKAKERSAGRLVETVVKELVA